MARKTKDPGFGYNSKKDAQSVINEDGSSNVLHTNRKRNMNDLFTYFINISSFKFILLIVFGYSVLNVLFGLIYVAIGIDQITNP